MAGTLKGLVTLHLSQEAGRAHPLVSRKPTKSSDTEESVFNGNGARGV